jgi:DNA primase catalytic core
MGLAKLTAGDGYTYLTRQVAVHDSTEKGGGSLAEYYSEKGESPGQWAGAGLAGLGIADGATVTEAQMRSLFGLGRHPNATAIEIVVAAGGGSRAEVTAAGALGRAFNVYDAASSFQVQVAKALTAYNLQRSLHWNTQVPIDERARIRSEVATAMFTDKQGRAPANDRELDGFVKKQSRQATSAVAGYDLTFSPVKSVSTLWALAPAEVAERIRAGHDAAVADTLAWLEREVAFTREGRGGARQVAVRGLVATAFTHRDTRAGDPDLHTHLAVANKVQTTDGRWLALDGRVVYQAITAASERYNTRLEAELIDRLGLSFHDTLCPSNSPRIGVVTGPDKRPVREIVGINPALIRRWSRRRRMIEARQADLAAEFQARHGRPPTPVEAYSLGRQAWRETRDAKHAPVSETEQRAAWRAEAAEVLGDLAEVDAMVDRGLTAQARGQRPTRDWQGQAAAATITAVSADRATWKRWHLRAEAERQARTFGVALDELDEAVNRVVDGAVALSVRLGAPDPITEPSVLRRGDGASVYDVHGTTRYTSAAVLAAERELLAAAQDRGGRALNRVRVGIAVAESAANGTELNDAQAAMVAELATSGRRLQLALAPAGTGKTTTMRVLAHAWTEAGGQVLGLAPSAQAAQELRGSIGCYTDTLAKLTWTLAHAPRDQWPAWVEQIGPSTVVIIDEAGQASTADLAATVRYVTMRGGLVRLVGDNQQLAAVGAGGVLRDIAVTVGAATLSQVRRFGDPAEAAVTLAVRDGDPAALGYYADHNRIHVGDLGAVTDAAYQAWAADRAAGLDAVLLAPTREVVSQLNARARADRLRTDPTRDPGQDSGQVPAGAEVFLADGTRASAGDVIITRRNDRRLVLSGTDWVKNGDRWIIVAVNADRSLQVRHHGIGKILRLPADYVADHVQLGYATTVHGAQGMTTDTSHTVVLGTETRELLYVAISRGRTANHVYVANGYDGDPHTLIHPEALLPATAIDVLATILNRDGTQASATTTQRELEAPAPRLHGAVLRYRDALGFAAERTVGDQLEALDAEIEVLWPGLTSEDAYPSLRGHLALLALDNVDPVVALADAADSQPLTSLRDRAAVLDRRLPEPGAGPLPWLPPVPNQLAEDPGWGPYLTARASRIETLAQLLRADAAGWSPTQTPSWAAPLGADLGTNQPDDLADDPRADLRGDVAVWRAAHAVPDADSRPTGPRSDNQSNTHQRVLDQRVRAATGPHLPIPSEVDELLPSAVTEDPGLGRLTQHLDALTAAGLDVTGLLAQAVAEPRPLPDEHAADALWWRIVAHLGPAAIRATANSATQLRPVWTADLVELLGPETAHRVMADPAWPALVAAVHARPADWSAQQLLVSVIGPRTPELPDADLCPALVWRVATMTDAPEYVPDDIPEELGEPLEAPLVDRVDWVPVVGPTPGLGARLSVARIVELNRLALAFYERHCPRSWVPGYLRERLGNDLSGKDRFAVGYAPPGPTSLISHLRGAGADLEELIEAGLARRTDRGTIVDSFRDRLMFPIHSANDELVGFIARRNPTKDQDDHAGPKYLNTRTTAAFTKGEHLYGLHETHAQLTSGAVPVLVEGPLDAIAVTLAGHGAHVGIAPLGTAFTASQAQQFQPYLHEDPSRVVIATDPDPAGWAAAQKALWQLAAIRANPRHLELPDDVDPADLLRTAGPAVLADRLGSAESFAGALIDRLLADTAHSDTTDIHARIGLARQVAGVVGATPPDQWPDLLAAARTSLDLPPGILDMECLEAGQAWTDDPKAAATRAIALTTHRAEVLAHRLTPPPPTTEAVNRATNASPDRTRHPQTEPSSSPARNSGPGSAALGR